MPFFFFFFFFLSLAAVKHCVSCLQIFQSAHGAQAGTVATLTPIVHFHLEAVSTAAGAGL